MSAGPHYVAPGRVDGWLAVVRGGNALLVQPGSASPEELYDALAGADAVRSVIERLTAGGFAATPDFGLVAGSSAGPRHVVVRGPVVVELPEGEVSGAEVSTWAERVVSASSTYRILAPADGDGSSRSAEALPLLDGIVWGSSISNAAGVLAAEAGAVEPAEAESAAPSEGAPSEGAPTEAAPAEAPPADEDVPADADAPAGADSPAPSAAGDEDVPVAPAPSPSDPSDAVQEETVLPEETVHPDALPAPAEAPASDEEPAGYDHLFEATIVRPVEAAAVRPVEEDEAAEPPATGAADVDSRDGDHDGLTVLSGDVEGLASRPRPAESEVARPDDRAAYSVVLPDGTREPLDGELLVGRSPSGRVTGDRMPRLVTLSGDPDISRTHVRIALEGDTVVVTDMHSRNGTTLRIAGQSPQLLRAGEPAAVIPGSVVDLGGGTLLTIEQDGGAPTGPERSGSAG